MAPCYMPWSNTGISIWLIKGQGQTFDLDNSRYIVNLIVTNKWKVVITSSNMYHALCPCKPSRGAHCSWFEDHLWSTFLFIFNVGSSYIICILFISILLTYSVFMFNLYTLFEVLFLHNISSFSYKIALKKEEIASSYGTPGRGQQQEKWETRSFFPKKDRYPLHLSPPLVWGNRFPSLRLSTPRCPPLPHPLPSCCPSSLSGWVVKRLPAAVKHLRYQQDYT